MLHVKKLKNQATDFYTYWEVKIVIVEHAFSTVTKRFIDKTLHANSFIVYYIVTACEPLSYYL